MRHPYAITILTLLLTLFLTAQAQNKSEPNLKPTVIVPQHHADPAKTQFVKGPPDKELIAHNSPGENWEGLHVSELKSFRAMEKALKKSNKEPILIFKHSTTCPINARAAYRVNEWLEEKGEDKPKIYFVKVIESKPISLTLAKDLDVIHESPQILLIENGKSHWDTSHADITAENIEEALEKLTKKNEKKK
jgi:bacillithiol system protein YtxJ